MEIEGLLIKEINEKILIIENALSALKSRVNDFEKINKKFHSSLDLKSVMINQDDDMIKIAKLLETDIKDIDISIRALNCLKGKGYNKIGEVLVHGEVGVLMLPHAGVNTLLNIKNELKNLGLKFPYRNPPR